MAGQTAAVDTSRRAAVIADVLDVHARLSGPAGEPIGEISPAMAVGIGPAAACYATPSWARSSGRRVPLLWLWPAPSWAEGPRPNELRLAAAFGLAAAVDHLNRQAESAPARPTLTLVRSDGTTSGPPARGKDSGPLDLLLPAIERRRALLVDLDGVDPVRSLRPRIDDQLGLSAACYLLPAELRTPSCTNVPLMWALPDEDWIEYPDRVDELIEGIALLLAAIELVDLTEKWKTRIAPLVVIEGGTRPS